MVAHRFAVIGNPIAHSLSPIIHQCFAEQAKLQLTYEKILGDAKDFEVQVADFFATGGTGLNCTLPFKQRAFAMAKKTTVRCLKAGAANTLWMQDGDLWADNTDGIGLIHDLARYIDLAGKNVLILGAGGAARGIIGPLLEAKIATLVLANRTAERAEQVRADFPQIKCIELTQLAGSYDLVINATSASIEGKSVFIPQECMQQKALYYDLSYQQNGLTPFVAYAKNQGCEAIDGLGMLVEQAAEAFYIWNKTIPDTDSVLKILRP